MKTNLINKTSILVMLIIGGIVVSCNQAEELPLLEDTSILCEPVFMMDELWEGRGGRSIITAHDGTLLAFNGGYLGKNSDGGKTWPVKRLVFDGPSAYSILGVGRAGTPNEGKVNILFEGGPEHHYQEINIAVLNLSWILEGHNIYEFLKK